MMIIQPVLQPQIVRVLVTLGLAAAAAVMISAAVSSLTAKTTTATLVAYLLIGVLWGGTLLAWVGRDRPFGHDLVESLLSVNPIAAAFSLIELPGFADYELIPLNWGLMTITCVVAALVVALQTRRLTRPS